MTKTVRYDAFISYRHCEPDSEIASRLQKKLEGFRLPKEIAKKTGRKRLSRIFRDETEFAVSDDLTRAIDEAIANSDFLICICSPEYLKSSWCRKEIASFLKFHDRKHVLLVLADGEPAEAFPPEIIYDDLYKIGADGRPYWTKVAREPLAADCRGETSKERNPKIDKATMRLIATILGIRFDDLKQRHRHEQYKRTRNRMLVALGVLAAFLAVCIGFLFRIAGQNREIMEQNEIISLKYADTLAATSDNLLRDGKRMDAIYAARLALSDEKTDNYSELATKALTNALGIYDLPNTFGCDSDVLLPCSVLDEMVISSDGGYASVKDLDHIRYVVDMNSGATVYSFEEDDISDFVFDGEKGFVYKRQDENYCYYDLAAGTLTDLGISNAHLYSGTEGEGVAIGTDETFALYKGGRIICNINYSAEGFSESIYLDVTVDFVPSANECWVFITDYDSDTTTAFILDMQSGSSRRMQVSDRVCYDITTDGKSIIWKQDEDYTYSLCIMDIVNGTVKSTVVGDIYKMVVLNDDVVVVSEADVTILNKDLNEVERFETGYSIRMFISGDAIYLMDSTSRFYKIMNGKYVSYGTILTDVNNSWMQEFRNGKLYCAITGDNHIYTYTFRQSDYMTVTTGDYKEVTYDSVQIQVIGEDPDAASFVDLIMESETEFEQNRIKRVAMCQNADFGLVQLYDGAVHIYDSSTGEKLKTIYSIEGAVNVFYYDRQSGYYYISAWDLHVYDEDFKNIYSINDCVLVGIEKQSGDLVVYDMTNSNSDNISGHYTLCPVTYNQLISIADECLDGYEPDERVKEKYSLG
ncbi:MAG: toll/interleukin-1 receptor domain-containing protein [Saccharofermentans sp.]|nr:toll/interleukin-1 receptor domain-containing protein [Saccharofermentans sp.]